MDLLWIVNPRHRRSRPQTYRAPSWSWASMDGLIQWQGSSTEEEHIEHMMKIVDWNLQTHSEDTHQTGSVRGGTLVVEGFLKKPFKIERSTNSMDVERERWSTVLTEPPDNKVTTRATLNLDIELTSEQRNDLQLLPIRRATGQDRKHYHPDPMRNPASQRIQGLAVLAHCNSEVYERVGLFEIFCLQPDFQATNWFSDTMVQTITIK